MSNPLTWQVVDAIAAELGATDAARAKWRQRQRGVPPAWQLRITRELMARGAPVSLDAFGELEPNPGRIAA